MEPVLYLLLKLTVEYQLSSRGLGDDLAGQIVLRGPRPPPVMTTSERSSARPMTSLIRPGLSPTTVL